MAQTLISCFISTQAGLCGFEVYLIQKSVVYASIVRTCQLHKNVHVFEKCTEVSLLNNNQKLRDSAMGQI